MVKHPAPGPNVVDRHAAVFKGEILSCKLLVSKYGPRVPASYLELAQHPPTPVLHEDASMARSWAHVNIDVVQTGRLGYLMMDAGCFPFGRDVGEVDA